MKEQEFDYKQDLVIDELNLDGEWIKQPSTYMKWAEEQATAQLKRDRLKEKMAIVQAKLDLRIRNKPDKYGIDKPTESAIRSAIFSHSLYKKANKAYLKSVWSTNVLASAVEAMSHKKKALEKLTDLYISGYYSEVKVRKGDRETVGKVKAKESLKALRKAMDKKGE